MSLNAVQRWLQSYCERGADVVGALVLSPAGEGHWQAAGEWPAPGALSAPLLAAAKAAVQRAEPVVVVPAVTARHAEHARLIAVPLGAGARPQGAVALALRSAEEPATGALLQDLERASGALVATLSTLAGPTPSARLDAARALHLQSLLLGAAPLAQAAGALVNELAATLEFERVSLGLLEQGRLSVLAVSHNGEFQGRQELVRALAGAMQEAIDQGGSVRYPAGAEAPVRIVLAHAELGARSAHSVCSVPLVSAGRLIGALSFERAGSAPSGAELAGYEHLACLLGPLLALRQRAEQPWRRRAGAALRRLGARLRERDDARPRIAAALALGALGALTLVPLPYRVGAPARLEGAVQRILAAPADGYLRAAHVRPGDTVQAGALLVELADQDLALEKRKWESELAQHENSYAAALARADRAQFVISQAKASEARAQLELVHSQLSRTRLSAPIDAVVIQGDLSQSLGAPVQRGEALLTLAPRDQYRLIVAVDERDIAAIQPGQRGQLALSALPAHSLAFSVERVSPVATTQEGRNAFEVQARLEAAGLALRPGLQGVAKIEVGSRPAAWLLTHRITDWLRLTLWQWGL